MSSQKQLTIKNLFNCQARTTTTTGSAVDLQGTLNPIAGRNMKAYLDVSANTGTTPSVVHKIQEGDNTTTFTDITGAVFQTVTTTGTYTEELHFVTQKRYVRAVSTYTANTTSSTYGIYLLAEKVSG